MNIDWQKLTIDLQNFRLISIEELGLRIGEVIKYPQENILAIVLLASVVLTILLICLITVLLLWSSISGSDKAVYTYTVDSGEFDEAGHPIVRTYREEINPKSVGSSPIKWYIRFLFGFGLFVVLWASFGVSSQARTVCLSCHEPTYAALQSHQGSHANQRCVACHERGGIFESVTLSVPARAAHMWDKAFQRKKIRGSHYGAVDSTECLNCHDNVLEGTIRTATGVDVSHREPYETGMSCKDCHYTDNSEKKAEISVPMQTCLRCHDGERASVECDSCHASDPVSVANATYVPSSKSLLRTNPRTGCYDCHNAEKSCDPCHGTRMPHDPLFKEITHSEYGNDPSCRKCHDGDSPVGATLCEDCHDLSHL